MLHFIISSFVLAFREISPVSYCLFFIITFFIPGVPSLEDHQYSSKSPLKASFNKHLDVVVVSLRLRSFGVCKERPFYGLYNLHLQLYNMFVLYFDV